MNINQYMKNCLPEIVDTQTFNTHVPLIFNAVVIWLLFSTIRFRNIL